MKYAQGSFITVPSRESLRGLPPTAQTLYMWLCSYANETGTCFPSRKRLAEDCGCSEDTIDKMLIVLMNQTLVEKKNRVENREKLSNLYTVLIDVGTRSQRLPYPPTAVTVPARNGINSIQLTQSTEQGASRVEVVEVSEEEKPKKVKADVAYYSVFELFGLPWPLDWKNNITQINAAKNLLLEHGLQDCKEAIAFYQKHKDDEYCPKIRTPIELSRKWHQLEDHLERI